MAPRRKSPRKKASESSNASSREYTPVKASTSRNDVHTPAVCATRRRTDYESVDDSPSPGIFSPVNKPTSDIEWAWKSPVGRMGSAANSTKRRLINKTPVQKTKRSSKANSPLNHFPSKRKLIKVGHEDTDHLSILTSQLEALKQCVLDEMKPDPNSGSSTTPPNNSGSSTSTPPNKNIEKEEESFTGLLDDDNFFTLLQCSQYVEEKLMDNPNKTAFSPIYIKPSAKIISSNQELASEPSCTRTMIGSHLVSSKEVESSTETNQQVVIETDKDKELSRSDTLVVASVNIVSSRECASTATVGLVKPVQEKPVDNYKFDSNFADDSFDCVLANFCDENVELLSQGKSSSQQETPNNVLEVSISCEEKRVDLPSSPETREVASVAVETKTMSAAASSSALYSFDDDFLQPDMLKMLDAIECSSLANLPSATERRREPLPPHQCTPEEIEKKRLEAKMKLAKKKRAAIVETHRLPSRSSFGNVRR